MIDEQIKVTIIGEDGGLSKSLGTLQAQLKRFEKGLTDATNPKSFERLDRAILATKKRIESIKVRDFGLNPDNIDDTTNALRRNAKGSQQAGQALSNLGRVAQDAPFGFIGIQNNLNPLLESFQRLRKESGSNIGALKALGSSLLGAGGIGFALSAVSSLLLIFGDRLFKSSNQADKLKEKIDQSKKATDDFISTLNDVAKARLEGVKSAQDELINAELLYKASQNQNLSYSERKKAVDALQDQYPKYFANIKDEIVLNGGAEESYKKLTKAILASARAEAAKEGLVDIQKQILDNEALTIGKLKETTNILKQINAEKKKGLTIEGARGEIIETDAAKKAIDLSKDLRQSEKETNKIYQERIALQNRALLLRQDINDVITTDGVDAIIPDITGVKPAKEKIDKLANSLAEADAKFRSFATAIKTGLLVQAPKIDLIVPVTPKYNLEGASAELSKAVELQRDQFESDMQRIFAAANVTMPTLDFNKIVDFNATQAALLKMLDNVQRVRDAVAGSLTPAFQSLFTAITNNEAPLQAFFKSLQQSIIQLINQLIAAAIKALVLKIITGGIGGGGLPQIGGKFTTAGAASFGRAGQSVTGGGLSGVNTRFAGLNPMMVEVSGVVRGNNIALINARTSQTQRRGG